MGGFWGGDGTGCCFDATNTTQHTHAPTSNNNNHKQRQVSTKAIWDIYIDIAKDVAEPVDKMLSWFEEANRPRIDALIFTGGGTKSAVIRSLVEDRLYNEGSGPLANKEALSNGKVRRQTTGAVCVCIDDGWDARVVVFFLGGGMSLPSRLTLSSLPTTTHTQNPSSTLT